MDTLIINTWYSVCGNCGKEADPTHRIHAVILGYSSQNGQPGCMVEWDSVSSDYDDPKVVDAAKAMRPDLTWVERR